jgi:hypothetical protein
MQKDDALRGSAGLFVSKNSDNNDHVCSSSHYFINSKTCFIQANLAGLCTDIYDTQY